MTRNNCSKKRLLRTFLCTCFIKPWIKNSSTEQLLALLHYALMCSGSRIVETLTEQCSDSITHDLSGNWYMLCDAVEQLVEARHNNFQTSKA
ncbi:MAG: hypothetical protein Tsb005_14380 [Gammaproteobacteria bacterium]